MFTEDEYDNYDPDIMEIVERLEEVLDRTYEEEYEPLDFEDED